MEVAPPELDDADVVVRRDQVPQVALGLGELEVHLVVLQRARPIAELPERVAEVRRGHLAELLGADLRSDFHRLQQQLFRLEPVAERVLDRAERVLDVAVDDVRLRLFEQLHGPLGLLPRRDVVVDVLVDPGDPVEELRHLERFAELLVDLPGVVVIRQRRVLLAALRQHLADLLHHSGEIGVRRVVLRARLDALEKVLVRLHGAAEVAAAVVGVGELLAHLGFVGLVDAGEVHQVERAAVELRRLLVGERAQGEVARVDGVVNPLLRLVGAREVIGDLAEELGRAALEQRLEIGTFRQHDVDIRRKVEL